jgi:hypothetical protein
MKQILILSCVLLSCSAHAQKKNRVHKLFAGCNFSTDYSYRSLHNNDGSSSSDIVINARKDESAKFGYTTGLNFLIQCSDHVGFETGIQYSNKGYKTGTRSLTYFPPDPTLPTQQKTVATFNYIGIPLQLKFITGKNKLRFVSGIGLTTSLLLQAKQTIQYTYSDRRKETHTQNNTSFFKKIDLSPMISAGIDYTISNKIHLTAAPTFRYGVLKTTNTPVTESLWSAGLNAGFCYSMK